MKVFLIAGEPSGDLLGARLMNGIRHCVAAPDEELSFIGVGGERMEKAGLQSLFPMSDLTLFGVAELLPKIPLVLRRIKETARAIRREKPDVVVTIDAPDFCFRVAKRLVGSGIPFVHYVAPTVWAWRPGRAKKIQAFYQHLLTLFPFEPPYFERVGLDSSFVGHPLIEAGIHQASAERFRAKYHLESDRPILVVLPGSRRSEHKYLIDIFGKTIDRLLEAHPEFKIVVPTVPHLYDLVRKEMEKAKWKGDPLVFTDDADKYDAFKAAHVALAASGTVALELGLAGTPSVIAYKIHPVTAALYRRFIHTKFANLVNIMHDKMLVPEFIQENCTPEHILSGLMPLIDDPATRGKQKAGLDAVWEWLSPEGGCPAQKAAQVVLAVAHNTKKHSKQGYQEQSRLR